MLWSGPRLLFAVLAFLVWAAVRPCLAGESYLDRNAKVHEAVPYGRSSEETPLPVAAAAATPRQEDHTPAAEQPPPPAR